mgnify:CR=1 FL=1
MPYRVTRYEETPNPNALKCILDRAISDHPKSFRSPDAAAGDALAESLFAVDGVAVIYMNADWMTINKAPAASWKSVKSGVERVLSQAP